MAKLRKLIVNCQIGGVIFPALDRLSREPLHQLIFELEAKHANVIIHYADAPNGADATSQFTRTVLAYAAKLIKSITRTNNIAGAVCRIAKGMVPAGRVPYGYKYRSVRDPVTNRVIKA